MSILSSTLFYIADPMCSWCWGFRSVRDQVEAALPAQTRVRYVMGGLAPDSSEAMDGETRRYVRAAWEAVEATAGVRFNWDFWDVCTPRRSTYPACRAVLAAEQLQAGTGPVLFDRIQEAYYEQARNPSDLETLVQLGQDEGLDGDDFRSAMTSPEVEGLLQADFTLRRDLGVHAFPTLVLDTGASRFVLTSGYSGAEEVLGRLAEIS